MTEAKEVKPDLPKGWAWTKIEDIAKLNFRDPGISSLPDDFIVTFLPMAAVDAEKGIIAKPEKRPLAQVRKGFTSFSEKDVLFAKITPSMENGKAAIACDLINGRGFGSTEFHVISPKAGILSEWLFYFIRQEKFRRNAKANFAGTAGQLRVPADFIKNYPVPLAPNREQHRIVDRIEELFSRLDAGVAALQRAKAQLRRYRQAVLKAAVEGRLTEDWRRAHPEVELAKVLLKRIIGLSQKKSSKKYSDPRELAITGFPSLPESWLWVRLDSIASLKGGITKDAQRRINNGRKVPYLRVANVQRGYLDLNQIKEIEASEEVISELILECGDILFNEGGDRDKLGRGWIWQGELPECIHQNHVFRARLYSNEVSNKFVSWFGNTYGQEYFLKEGKQTTNLASINLTKLSAFPVPLPPNEEQIVIVEEIEKRISMANESEKKIDQSLKRASRLRQSILKRAFEGKLVTQDTNDEHAKVLLERIEANKKKPTPIKETKYRNKNLRTNGKKRETNLYELLRSSTRYLTPSELWTRSNLDIEDFYCRLKLEIEKGRIIEDKINNKLIFKDERHEDR